MRHKTITTSYDVVFIDTDRADEELVITHCGGDTSFFFLDEHEFELDVDFNEALEFADLFILQLGWKVCHSA